MEKEGILQKDRALQGNRMRVLSLSALALIGVVVVACIVNAWLTHRLNEENEKRYMLYQQAIRLCDGSKYLTNEVRAYSATGNIAHYDNYWNEVKQLKNRDKALENMKAIGLSQQELDVIEKIGALSNGLIPLEEEAMEAVKAGHRKQALGYVYGEKYEEVIQQIYGLTSEFQTSLERRTRETTERFNLWQNIVVGITFVVLALLLFFELYFIGYIKKMNQTILAPVKQISKQLNDIAHGALFDVNVEKLKSDPKGYPDIVVLQDASYLLVTILRNVIRDMDDLLRKMAEGNFNIHTKDEKQYVGDFHSILDSIRVINRKLSASLAQINLASEQVALHSEQMAGSAESLATGAVEQADVVEKLTVAAEDLAKSAHESAGQAKDAYEQAEHYKLEAQESNKQMESLTKAMARINDMSKKIESIIEEIENIAAQTNLLSLNASIEAARAGEAGKGFAVVANQIGKLAADSAKSAVDTRALIGEALNEIENGNAIMRQTTGSLEKVIDGIGILSESSREISQISSSQASAVEQIREKIGQISGVAQNNSAAAEETSAVSEEMSAQSEHLKKMVDQFQLRPDSV